MKISGAIITSDYNAVKALKLKTIVFGNSTKTIIQYTVDSTEYGKILKLIDELHPVPKLKWYQAWERIKKHFTEL